MALPPFDSSLFEETRVSLEAPEDAAIKFFESHGVFFQGQSELGQLAQKLRSQPLDNQNLDVAKAIAATDPVSTKRRKIEHLLKLPAPLSPPRALLCDLQLHPRPRQGKILLDDEKRRRVSYRRHFLMASWH